MAASNNQIINDDMQTEKGRQTPSLSCTPTFSQVSRLWDSCNQHRIRFGGKIALTRRQSRVTWLQVIRDSSVVSLAPTARRLQRIMSLGQCDTARVIFLSSFLAFPLFKCWKISGETGKTVAAECWDCTFSGRFRPSSTVIAFVLRYSQPF